MSALLHLAGMRDADGFANQLFEAKSTITGITDEALVTMDYKQFGFADSKWGIAAIETVNPNQVLRVLTDCKRRRKPSSSATT